jgi:hypothetical protein
MWQAAIAAVTVHQCTAYAPLTPLHTASAEKNTAPAIAQNMHAGPKCYHPCWAGYVAYNSQGNVWSSAYSQWHIPYPFYWGPPIYGRTDLESWVGLGGFVNNDALFQTGTTVQDTVVSGANFIDDFAWVADTSPTYREDDFSLSGTYSENAGDNVTASVSNGSCFYIQDWSAGGAQGWCTGWAYPDDKYYECVDEQSNSPVLLAAIYDHSFSQCWAYDNYQNYWAMGNNSFAYDYTIIYLSDFSTKWIWPTEPPNAANYGAFTIDTAFG